MYKKNSMTNNEQQTTKIYYWTGVLLVLVASFCFAIKGVFIKIAYQHGADTITILALRMIFSAPFFAIIAVRLFLKDNGLHLTSQQWTWALGLGITGYYGASFLDFESLNYISAGLERILLFVYPTFVLFINAFFRKKPVTRLQWFALLLTYLGIFLAFIENIDSGQQKNIMLGTFWVILSGLVYAIYLVGNDKIIPQIGAEKFTALAMLAATLPTVLHCAALNHLQIWQHDKEVYQIGALLAIVATVIPTFMIAEGIKRVGSSNTSIIASIGPVFTIILATTILDEIITPVQLFGTALVLLGVFLIGWKGKK
jgi:drug/metabolite transporter (DMT)-like permease